MILITGIAKVAPEHRDTLIAAATAMSKASLQEAGCLDYRFWISADDPNLMLMLEKWEDQAALDAHFATPHLAEFSAALGPAVDGGIDLLKYEVASVGPLF
jgi:quinol monooxygenase YgiN